VIQRTINVKKKSTTTVKRPSSPMEIVTTTVLIPRGPGAFPKFLARLLHVAGEPRQIAAMPEDRKSDPRHRHPNQGFCQIVHNYALAEREGLSQSPLER